MTWNGYRLPAIDRSLCLRRFALRLLVWRHLLHRTADFGFSLSTSSQCAYDPKRFMRNGSSQFTIFVLAFLVSSLGAQEAVAPTSSEGMYRLPYADETSVKVFDDFQSHRPMGRIDFFGVGGTGPYRIVAAAAGRIVAIQDAFSEQQSGRAAKDCHNNYVWIAHANGEWTNYSHLARGSVTGAAGLHVGDSVEAGRFLGYEGAVGCAMLNHLHFEVAKPSQPRAIDEGGFLLDNDNAAREHRPRFCGVVGDLVEKDKTYTARPCGPS
jgi:hypothetical protein